MPALSGGNVGVDTYDCSMLHLSGDVRVGTSTSDRMVCAFVDSACVVLAGKGTSNGHWDYLSE